MNLPSAQQQMASQISKEPEKQVPKKTPAPAASGEYTPASREVTTAVIKLWEQHEELKPASMAKVHAKLRETHPTWSISEKRMKACLKEFNIAPARPPVTFAKLIKSDPTPQINLPPHIKMVMTKTRGKALFAARHIEKDELLWTEAPLVQAPPVELLRMVHAGLMCAFCARNIKVVGHEIDAKSGHKHEEVVCGSCAAKWCSEPCRRADGIHGETWHNVPRNKIRQPAWRKFEQHCTENSWTGAHIYGRILLHKLKADPRKPGLVQNIDSMARVRNDLRLEHSLGRHSLEHETNETMWRESYQLLAEAVRGLYSLGYEEFQEGVGLANLNNLDHAIFLIYSHLNHSCDPNVEVHICESRPEGIQVRAKHAIKAGQELVTTYVDPFLGVEQRRDRLRAFWGFNCNCDRCKSESQPAPSKPRPRGKSVSFIERPETIEV